MIAIDAPALISDRTIQFAPAPSPQPIFLTACGQEDALGDDRWRLALERLYEWIVDPSAFDEDEIEPPSRGVIQAAERLLGALRHASGSKAYFPVPDGEGGVCFERESGSLFEEYRLAKSGELSYRRFLDGQLTGRAILGVVATAGADESDRAEESWSQRGVGGE